MASQSESGSKQNVRCKGCGKEVQLLLSHLKRTKEPCKSFYDMEALEAEAKTLHKEQMAARNKDRYHNEPGESPRKRAASREHYKKLTQEMKTDSLEKCTESSQPADHPKIPVRIVCDICEKVFGYLKNLNRHMKEIHGEEKKFGCTECCQRFSRNDVLKRHVERGKHTFKVVCNYCDENYFFKTEKEAERKMMQHYTFGKMYPGTRNVVGCRWYCVRCIKFHCINEHTVSDEKREVLLRRRLEEDDGNQGDFNQNRRNTVNVSDEFWEFCLKTWREELKTYREEEKRRIDIEEKVKKEKETPFFCTFCKTTCIGILKNDHYGDWRSCDCPGCVVAGYTHECGRHQCNEEKCQDFECRRKRDNTPYREHELIYWKKNIDSGKWKVDPMTYENFVIQLKNHDKLCKKGKNSRLPGYCDVCPITF